MVCPFLSSAKLILGLRVWKGGEEPSGGIVLRLIRDPFNCDNVGSGLQSLLDFSRTKRSQLFVVAVRVNNPDRSSLRING
jgi:hypothetical protein